MNPTLPKHAFPFSTRARDWCKQNHSASSWNSFPSVSPLCMRSTLLLITFIFFRRQLKVLLELPDNLTIGYLSHEDSAKSRTARNRYEV